MRTLIFIILLVFTVSAFGQSPLVSRAFGEGTAYAKVSDFEKALKSYRKTLFVAGNEDISDEFLAKIHFNIGVCLYQMDQPAPAVVDLKKAVALRKGIYPKAQYALGMAETANKNWPEARQAFVAALRINKNDGEAWFDLASVYIAETDFENAERAFKNSVAYKTVDSPLSHNNIGVILALKSDFSAAEKEFEIALAESGGTLIEARNNLEYCKARSGKRPELLAKLEFSNKNRSLRVRSV
jgi:tetratricopeptide (TPR) repeat protein